MLSSKSFKENTVQINKLIKMTKLFLVIEPNASVNEFFLNLVCTLLIKEH